MNVLLATFLPHDLAVVVVQYAPGLRGRVRRLALPVNVVPREEPVVLRSRDIGDRAYWLTDQGYHGLDRLRHRVCV